MTPTPWIPAAAAALLCAQLLATAASADDPAAAEEKSTTAELLRLLDNEYYKVNLDVRGRIELADFETIDSSQAYTVRALAGVGNKPIYGLSAYAELLSTMVIDGDTYFNTVEPPTGQSPIAEPGDTDLHQLYARYQNADLLGADLTVGRQRIILDDHRFIGNVGWRQNEQVFDAVRASSTLGVEGMTLFYGYIDYVTRIFGNQGPPPMRNYRSESHLLHLAYDKWPAARIAAFAYLLDFDNSPVNSSNSYGFRVTGVQPIVAPWTLSYATSYAVQTEAGDNPADYVAHYFAAEGTATYQGIGGLGIGYELLGSDDGDQQFVTPLSTAHKFNGWADAFLDNGGPNGLQDLYASFTPQLPFEIKGGLIYHQFWSDQGGNRLGWEFDAIFQRAFGKYVTALTKFAYFDGHTENLADRWRIWFDLTFAF